MVLKPSRGKILTLDELILNVNSLPAGIDRLGSDTSSIVDGIVKNLPEGLKSSNQNAEMLARKMIEQIVTDLYLSLSRLSLLLRNKGTKSYEIKTILGVLEALGLRLHSSSFNGALNLDIVGDVGIISKDIIEFIKGMRQKLYGKRDVKDLGTGIIGIELEKVTLLIEKLKIFFYDNFDGLNIELANFSPFQIFFED